MSLEYRIYGNDGAGGPVDVSTPIATTSSLSYSLPALALNSDNLFLVRTHDTVTDLEDKSVEAIIRIVIDGSGADVSNRPAPPSLVTARISAAAKAFVTWIHSKVAPGGKSVGFKVWMTAGGTVDYTASPNATVPVSFTRDYVYRTTLTGLTDGTLYTIGVRAYNATGLSVTANECQVTGKVTSAPDSPDAGSASVSFRP